MSGSGAGTGSEPFYIVLAVLATPSHAIALNIARRPGRIEATVAITWAFSLGFGIIAPFALFPEGLPGMISVTAQASMLASGLGLTALPFMVLYTQMPRVGAVNVSLVTFVAPVSALIIGVGPFEEVLTFANLTGVLLILLGLMSIDGRTFSSQVFARIGVSVGRATYRLEPIKGMVRSPK